MQSLEKKIEKSIVSGRSTKMRTQAVDLGE